MLSNYLSTALRNLKKDLSYSVINMVGLALGIAACLLSFLHVNYERSYDQFHSNSKKTYRVVAGDPDGGEEYWARMAPTVTPYLQDQFAEVEDFVRVGRISWNPKVQVNYGLKQFNEDKFLLVDPSFFSVFDFRLLHGESDQVLKDPSSVVITESMAKKYFGMDTPIGKELEVDGRHTFVVTGIIEDSPANSHLDYNFLVSFENLNTVFGEGSMESWGAYNYWGYILVNEEAKMDQLQSKIHELVIPINEEQSFTLDQIYIQPLTDIHFSDSRGNQKQAYDETYLLIFSLIAISVLLIASINFINLSTARSGRRVIEVGVRKAIGASKFQLVSQFIAESLLTSIVSLVLGLVIVASVLPYLNAALGSSISIGSILSPSFIAATIMITLLIGLASGAYIAFFVNSYEVSKALKGGSKARSGKFSVKDALLILQFTVSIVLVISSIFLTRQLYFIQDKNLGLNKDQVVTVPIYNASVQSKIPALKSELLKSSKINAVSASSFRAGNANWNQTVWWEGQEEPESMFILVGDADFVETLQLDMIEGDLERIKQLPEKERHYILNQSAVQHIGWESAEGNMFTAFGDKNRNPVAGVVNDFNFRSLHHTVSPTVIAISSNFNLDQILIRVNSAQDIEEGLAHIEAVFSSVLPEVPYEYGFLDEDFGKLYAEENRAEVIIESLTAITITIALFGLFAMASFSLQERTKEIAIRKVIGISTGNLIMLLSKKYIWLLIASNVLAWPIAWMLSYDWLQRFPYRIGLDWWTFGLGTTATLMIVLLIVGGKSLKAAGANPVTSLRND